jgi:hypothetical protein
MKVIEIKSRTDIKGYLNMSYPLNTKERVVGAEILYDDSIENEETLWLKFAGRSPSFSFLMDKEEDVYSFEDGEPFHD